MWKAKLEGGTGAKLRKTAKLTAANIQKGDLILGVDPSLRGTGLAVVECQGRDRFKLCHSRTVKIPARIPASEALGLIAKAVIEVLDKWDVDHAAVEQTIYVQNFRVVHMLGAARGAAVAMVAVRNIPVVEYAPLSIKQSVVGSGRASKQQVASMIASILSLPKSLPADESDAAAVAVCHAFRSVKGV